ncbi:MAG: DUF1501 domain-containing protein [Planctomycetes bacterium]|nr:DUF1501 domain-containing protein [Planctomycetota bacterium]
MFPEPRRRGCKPSDHPRIGRRTLLQAGGLALIGTGLADLLRLESEATASEQQRRPRAKSVVFIFQSGGPSQHETFDPKPDAPDGIRGEYGTTQTALAGVRFCEYLPRLAGRAGKFAIVRTMHHPSGPQLRNEHNSCTYMLHTGTTELPAGDTNATIGAPKPGRMEWPSIGSLLAFALSRGSDVTGQSLFPAVIELPRANHMRYTGRGSGILGPRYDRWGVDLAPPCRSPDPAGSCPNCFSHDDPNDPTRAAGSGPNAWWNNSSCRHPDFQLPNLGGADLVSLPQLGNRACLLQSLENFRRGVEAAPRAGCLESWDVQRQRALQLVLATRPGRQNPFDLTQESDRIRDLYGREEWGQGFLVARRLVEAGVRMVQVNLRGWDTHQNAFRDLKGKLLPSLDRCLSGFLDDLEQRGLLHETLIIMCGEMGRTPRISPITAGGRNASGEIFTPGRHHWGDVFPCFFAGGGIRPGQIVGQTDRQGGLPMTTPYTPADLAATIFHLLGVGPDEEFRDAQGRPYRITSGTPIAPLLA